MTKTLNEIRRMTARALVNEAKRGAKIGDLRFDMLGRLANKLTYPCELTRLLAAPQTCGLTEGEADTITRVMGGGR